MGKSDEIRVFTGRGRSALDVVHRVTGSLIELLKLGQDSGSEFDLVVADRTLIDPHAVAALRLLILTGARLREILNLRWEWVDLERGLLLLPDSKTGRKCIVLNVPAMAVLVILPRIGSYVIPGDHPERPRADLNRPWRGVSKRADLNGVRIHDLRHTHASIGAGAGLGLPIIGKLLGHTQAATTARYAQVGVRSSFGNGHLP